VFDKVRENTAGLLGGARTTYRQAANLALNQTLVRSINTSLIALLPVGAILFVASTALTPGNELQDLSLVLFVGMLSGTYSSIFIATPVLAQIKEREPQYRTLAKRVATRASGGRGAQRKAARSSSTGATGTGASRPASRRAAAAQVLDDDESVEVADDLGLEEHETPQDDELLSDDVPATQASRVQSGRSYVAGPRQQPRRDGRGSSARHRPTGKRKRR
jgi:preprotein translocase subunit SecF